MPDDRPSRKTAAAAGRLAIPSLKKEVAPEEWEARVNLAAC